MQDFGKQAHETVSLISDRMARCDVDFHPVLQFVDFSESTLNSLASTVENLKAVSLLPDSSRIFISITHPDHSSF